VAENIPRFSQRLGAFLPRPQDAASQARHERFLAAEEAIYTNAADPIVNWDDRDLVQQATDAGLVACKSSLTVFRRDQTIAPAQLERWFADHPGSFAQRLSQHDLTPEDILAAKAALASAAHQVTWHSTVAFLTAAHD
ncbi:MAG TPA: hypothetical protein PKY10_14760, partial [Lentisphaeria bacterium]|nr:hypothetical protein [Lentisphaeria bacterium]